MPPALPHCLPGSRRPAVGRAGALWWPRGPRRRPWRRPSGRRRGIKGGRAKSRWQNSEPVGWRVVRAPGIAERAPHPLGRGGHVDVAVFHPRMPGGGDLSGDGGVRGGEGRGVKSAEVEVVWDPPWTQERMTEAAKLELGLRIVGGGGNDSFIGRGGDDILDGGGGFDRIRFDRGGVGEVEVDLGEDAASGTWDGTASTCRISNIEHVTRKRRRGRRRHPPGRGRRGRARRGRRHPRQGDLRQFGRGGIGESRHRSGLRQRAPPGRGAPAASFSDGRRGRARGAVLRHGPP